MRNTVRWLHVVVCVIGFAACGQVQSPIVGGEDGGMGDAPDASDPALPLTASCVGLPATCGASGTDSCCHSPEVVGGTYYRGYDLAGDPNSGSMNLPATVSNFRLDKYEVTVGRFRAFVNAGMGTKSNPPLARAGAHANIAGSGWDANWNANLVTNTAALIAAVKCGVLQTWTDMPSTNEGRPMNCLTWYEAMSFCVWDGGYLPTEAEWNYAATGGDQQRAYPWSSPPGSLTIDSSHASYYDGTDCVGDGMPSCALTDLVPVGTKPAGNSRWGQSDMGGNVWEWSLDWFLGYQVPCTDCAILTPGMFRIVRGGGFHSGTPLISLRTAYRNAGDPVTRIDYVGVRCARAP